MLYYIFHETVSYSHVKVLLPLTRVISPELNQLQLNVLNLI